MCPRNDINNRSCANDDNFRFVVSFSQQKSIDGHSGGCEQNKQRCIVELDSKHFPKRHKIDFRDITGRRERAKC